MHAPLVLQKVGGVRHTTLGDVCVRDLLLAPQADGPGREAEFLVLLPCLALTGHATVDNLRRRGGVMRVDESAAACIGRFTR